MTGKTAQFFRPEDEIRILENLFRRYFRRLYAFALKVVENENDANDIVQDVFIKIWENRGNIADQNIEAYLFRLLRNQCISHLRHQRVEFNRKTRLEKLSALEEVYRIDFIRDEPYKLIEKEMDEKIHEVMEILPERCRLVFKMSRFEGLKNREIAEKLKINIKNVEKHISKALQIYRKHFPHSPYLFFLTLPAFI